MTDQAGHERVVGNLTEGARHYVLILFPRLLKDIRRIGVPEVVRTSGLAEREVTSLYFHFAAVARLLPDHPDRITPDLWEHLTYCVQVMSGMVSAASLDDLVEAREQAVRKYLPQARESLEQEFEEQRHEGTVDFRLAGLLRRADSPAHSRELCMEAIRREREERFESLKSLNTSRLNRNQAHVVESARAYVVREMAAAPDDFATIDLVIRLLDLLRAVLIMENRPESPVSEDVSVERIVLGIGNVLYRKELGLALAG
ncbi:MAG: hypothetical protein R3180_11330 [Marinobacter sp.]|nr:hypothetical protein [Marinobacter sp.]